PALLSSALAALTAASVLFTSLTDAPQTENRTQPPAPRPVCADRILNENDEPAREEDTGEEDERGKKRRLAALPLRRRALWLGPLWLVGAVLVGLVSALLPGRLALLVSLGLTLGGFALAGKILFPEVPLRKLFSKKSLSALLVGAGAVWAAGAVLPLIWDGYDLAVGLVEALLYLAALCAGLTLARPPKKEPEPAPAPPQPLTFDDGHGAFRLK
ncbi:MAG: hypothetical protein ACSW8F_05510, partial [bacterium]